mmetsp:Transcript_5520/g.15387  ORF Transcript_5520/g.15387 Transcript_5520/m.15387 type:complete len:119 (-) Transcript_5520:843-1199(-)
MDSGIPSPPSSLVYWSDRHMSVSTPRYTQHRKSIYYIASIHPSIDRDGMHRSRLTHPSRYLPWLTLQGVPACLCLTHNSLAHIFITHTHTHTHNTHAHMRRITSHRIGSDHLLSGVGG